jgi:hypothetical protein
MDYTLFSTQYLRSMAGKVVARQLLRDSKGFVELDELDVVESNFVDYGVGIRYKIVGRLCKDAAVWTENNPRVDTVVDFLHFIEPPTLNSLKGITQSRVYQFWEKDTAIHAEGTVTIAAKSQSEWFAVNASYLYDASEEGTLDAKVTPDALPTEYRRFDISRGTLTLSKSDKPYAVTPAPNAAQVEADLRDYLAERMDGLQKIAAFKIFKQETSPGDSTGTYLYSDVLAEVSLLFTRAAVSLDADMVRPAPEAGAPAPENTSEDTFKGCLYWDAGETLPFTADISYRRVAADSRWTKPNVKAIDPAPAPLKSKRTLIVRYKKTDNGNTIVSEAVPVQI